MSYSYKQQSSKGKFHPADVNAGQSALAGTPDAHPAIKLATGGANATPAGVKKHSGCENYCKVTHKNASHGGPAKKAGANAIPEGVRKFSGKSVSKK